MPFWRNERVTPAQIIITGFLLLILSGTLLLMLPFATREPGSASFVDALFTATSATCVTGLILHDTVQYWTPFGQAVILLLIQVGGMGVVTMAVAIFMFSGKKIGLKQRWVMQESIAAPQVGGIVRMTGFILKTALAIEGVGAVLLAIRFCPQMGFFKGLWYAVFHSVSAFCNAGFDLMGEETAYSSLTAYVGDPLVSLTIAGLIVVGGLGFITWQDIFQHHRHLRAYRLQSKLILVTTAGLLLEVCYFLAFMNFQLPQWEGLSTGEKGAGCRFPVSDAPYRWLQYRGSYRPQCPQSAADDSPDADRWLTGFHGRRLQDHHPGSAVAERLCGVSPPQQCPLLRAAAGGAGAAQRQRHIPSVPGSVSHRRHFDLLPGGDSHDVCPV